MRVLVVEDELGIVSYLKRSLEDEGFAVEVATDGNDALDKLLTRPYDVVTLDVMLPSMNGYEVCRTAREQGVNVPILMLTAKDGEYDEADAFDMGADDFLRKPFSLVVLVARLRALLRRGARQLGEVLEVDGLRLDTRTREVSREGQSIELTPREYQILECLMRQPGVPRAKREILEYVWGPDFMGGENVVEVYVGYLRKKVDAPFGTTTLRTVRGRGYEVGE